ncbi:MAG TPA: arginine deiminase-related protein, partial [Paludibacter sp.]
MIEPVAFGFNQQTAVNNYFQQADSLKKSDIQKFALSEFTDMVEILRANGINVLVVKDTLQPHTPDSIFPNNWISFHEGGQAVLYPMF